MKKVFLCELLVIISIQMAAVSKREREMLVACCVTVCVYISKHL